jgi:transcriptional regulator with XRE-family HTH domain
MIITLINMGVLRMSETKIFRSPVALFREERGWSQGDFGSVIDCTACTVSYVENATKRITRKMRDYFTEIERLDIIEAQESFYNEVTKARIEGEPFEIEMFKKRNRKGMAHAA